MQLVAGGAGVSPFLAMLDHHRPLESSTPMQLLYSSRTEEDLLGRDLLGAETTVTLTREAPTCWSAAPGDARTRRGYSGAMPQGGETTQPR